MHTYFTLISHCCLIKHWYIEQLRTFTYSYTWLYSNWSSHNKLFFIYEVNFLVFQYFRRGLKLLKNAKNLAKVSNLQRETWVSEALAPSLVSNRLGMLGMLALTSSLKCFLRAYPRYSYDKIYYRFLHEKEVYRCIYAV